MTKLYIHVHVRKAIEGIGFLLSPLRALAAVTKRTRTHQRTQFALGDFHSFFSPHWFESMKEDQKLKFWLDVSIRKRIRNSKVTIKLYSFVSSKGTDDVMKIYDTKGRCGWEGGLSVFELTYRVVRSRKGWMWWRGYQENGRRIHSNQWKVRAFPYYFISKIQKNVGSNFENTKFKMESSKLKKF